MSFSPFAEGLGAGKILVVVVAVVHLAGCARPATDDRSSAAATDPVGLFRDVCGRIGDPVDGLVRAVENRGFRRARAAVAPRFLGGQPGRVWADRRAGEDVLIALERRGTVCTVAARKADIGLALRRFSEHAAGQAGPDRTVVHAVEPEPADDGGPVRAGFRVTPRPSGAPLAYTLLHTFSGDPSAAADAQLILRAELAPHPP